MKHIFRNLVIALIAVFVLISAVDSAQKLYTFVINSTEDTTPDTTDLVYLVEDPTGTPSSENTTLAYLFAAFISDTAYNATSWDAVTTIAPSKNAVRDKFETLGTASVLDTAAVTNGATTVSTGDQIYDWGVAAFQPLDTDLTTLSAPGTWKWIYYNGSQVATAVACGAANTFLRFNGASSAPTAVAVTDAVLSTTDVTTNNVTTAKHGFRPKLTNVAYSYLDETGTVRAAVTMPEAPGADKLVFWDHSATAFAYPTIVGGSLSGTVFTISTKDVDEDIWQAVDIPASAFECDGTNCTAPDAEVINSGPTLWFTSCSDAAGTMAFSISMPENWDGGNVYLELTAGNVDDASPTGTVEFEVQAQTRAAGAAFSSTWLDTVVIQFGAAIDTRYAPEIAESAVIACSGAGGNVLAFLITRDNDDGTNDTSTQVVEVWHAKVYYQIDDLDERD